MAGVVSESSGAFCLLFLYLQTNIRQMYPGAQRELIHESQGASSLSRRKPRGELFNEF